MAAFNNEGVEPVHVLMPDGHKLIYSFVFYRLDATERNSFNLACVFPCSTVPTLFGIDVLCERVPEANGSYNFSIRLRRMDHSRCSVRLSLHVKFYDENALPIVPQKVSRIEGILHGGELECTTTNIHPSDIRDIVCVKATIKVEFCHKETNLQCASKVITDKDSLHQKSKL